MRISELITKYNNHISGSQSDDTIVNKQVSFRKFTEHVGDIDVTLVTTEQLEEFRGKLLKTHKKTSIKTLINHLSSLFRYASEKKFIEANPCSSMSKLKVPEELQPDTLTEEEVVHLYKLIDHQAPLIQARDRLLVTIALHTGLRRIEISNLKWSDIDIGEAMLYVRNGKGSKSRMVPINETLMKELLAANRTCEYVVTNRGGGKCSRDSLTAIMRKYLKQLGHVYKNETRLALHSLRATFATNISLKSSPFVIQRLLGHSDVQTCMKYVGVHKADLKNAVKNLDK